MISSTSPALLHPLHCHSDPTSDPRTLLSHTPNIVPTPSLSLHSTTNYTFLNTCVANKHCRQQVIRNQLINDFRSPLIWPFKGKSQTTFHTGNNNVINCSFFSSCWSNIINQLQKNFYLLFPFFLKINYHFCFLQPRVTLTDGWI